MKKLTPFQKRNLKILLLSIVLIFIGVFFILLSIGNNFLSNFYYRRLHGFSADIGIAAAVLFGCAVALYFLRLILKHLNPKTFDFIWKITDKKFKIKHKSKTAIANFLMNEFKTFLRFITKLIQTFHIPLAGIGFLIIMFHVYIFLHLGFKWTFGYILGALDAIVLLILFLSGILRIFHKGIKNHRFLGILFVILMILHIIFV